MRRSGSRSSFQGPLFGDHGQLAGVIESISVNNGTRTTTARNVTISIGYNVKSAGLAMCGWITPLIEATLMPGADAGKHFHCPGTYPGADKKCNQPIMSVVHIALTVAIAMGATALRICARCIRDGQFDDLDSPPVRMLIDDKPRSTDPQKKLQAGIAQVEESTRHGSQEVSPDHGPADSGTRDCCTSKFDCPRKARANGCATFQERAAERRSTECRNIGRNHAASKPSPAVLRDRRFDLSGEHGALLHSSIRRGLANSS